MIPDLIVAWPDGRTRRVAPTLLGMCAWERIAAALPPGDDTWRRTAVVAYCAMSGRAPAGMPEVEEWLQAEGIGIPTYGEPPDPTRPAP